MSLKVYRVQFFAEIGKLCIKTPISCEITATWKRSAQVAKTTTIQFANGEAVFDQTISIPINMYYEESTCIFQQKKSVFSFTLHTPKGEKTAGQVIVDLASMLNNKLQTYEENYKLEKCPDKEARVFIKIRAELIGEQNPDSLSQVSGISASQNPNNTSTLDASLLSSLSIAKSQIPAVFSSFSGKKENSAGASPFTSIANEDVQKLKAELAKAKQQNLDLRQQLASAAPTSDSDMKKEVEKLSKQITTLKSEMQKSKTIQDKLQKQLSQTRNDHHEHEKELYATRVKLEEVYNQLVNALGNYL